MTWKKLGLIFNPNEHDISWLSSHAMMPLPIEIEGKLRVYYTGRHIDGRSRISYFEVKVDDPTSLLGFHHEPLLDMGGPGTFDDCGTVGTFVMQNDGEIWLYYNGYNVRNTVPWSNAIGLATSTDGQSFSKMFDGPVIDRLKTDPYFVISPAIIKTDKRWHMWYTSGTGWLPINDKMEPIYNIKYASSKDGINWDRNNEICIPQANVEECVARATVLQQGDILKMWFIYRGSRDFRDGRDSYRLGYAESNINSPTEWIRDDTKAGISPGPEHYDDKMQSYAAALPINGKVYLFYNGNGFGYNGVCAAIWED